jgi:hypothetical protein
LVDLLATGSYGKVYTAKNFESGQLAAMKIITPEEDENVLEFVLEISILRKCQHVNLTAHYGSYFKGDELFIVMELADGGTVGDFPAAFNRGLRETEVQQIMLGSLRGLDYMHSSGIIHRDIKGANILLGADGEVKLADFGVSYLFESHNGAKAKTFIGTPYWMAPEIIDTKSGGPPYDEKVDLWALGITAIELAEMNPPLYDMNPMRALFEIPSKPPPALLPTTKASDGFREFVSRTCDKVPATRVDAKAAMALPWFSGVDTDLALLQDLTARFKKACDSDEVFDIEDDGGFGDEGGGGGSAIGGSTPAAEPGIISFKAPSLRADTKRPANATSRPLKSFTTRRELGQQEAQHISKQQLKRQMKELRALQEKHLEQLASLQRAQDKEEGKRSDDWQSRKAKLAKKFESEDGALRKSHKSEKSKLRKAQVAEREKLVKQLTSQSASLLKAIKKDQSDEQKDYNKRRKAEAKKAGNSPAATRDKQWKDLLFVHHQRESKLKREQAFALAQRTDPYMLRIEQVKQKARLANEHRRATDEVRIKYLLTRQDHAVKKARAMQEQEAKNLVEKQELQHTQLLVMQKIEVAQGKRLADLESKYRYKALKQRQKAEAAAAKSSSESKRLRQRRDSETRQFRAQESAAAAEAEKALTAQHTKIREEQARTHEKFRGILREDHETMLSHLQEQHEKAIAKMRGEAERVGRDTEIEQSRELMAMYTVYYNTVLQTLEEQHTMQKELALIQMKQQMGLLLDQQKAAASDEATVAAEQEQLKNDQRKRTSALLKEQMEAIRDVKRQRDEVVGELQAAVALRETANANAAARAESEQTRVANAKRSVEDGGSRLAEEEEDDEEANPPPPPPDDDEEDEEEEGGVVDPVPLAASQSGAARASALDLDDELDLDEGVKSTLRSVPSGQEWDAFAQKMAG